MARTTGERGTIVSNSNLTNFRFEVQRGEMRNVFRQDGIWIRDGWSSGVLADRLIPVAEPGVPKREEEELLFGRKERNPRRDLVQSFGLAAVV